MMSRAHALRGTTAVVILIDAHSAIIDRCSMGTLTRIRCVVAPRPRGVVDHMGDAPRQFYHPGTRGETASDAAQRSRMIVRARFISDVAPIVETAAAPEEWIVIGGNRQLATALRRLLLRSRGCSAIVADGLHRALHAQAIVARVGAAVDAHLAAQDMADVQTLLERTGAHTTGVVGPVASLDAAEHGAVEVVLMSPKYRDQHPEEVARLTAATSTHGGRIEIITPAAGALLDAQAGGIGALLRFALHKPAATH